MKTYSEKLSDPRWQRRRTEIYARDGWRCVWCKDGTTNLQVDHKRYIKGREPWESPDSDLQTLCKTCHARVTELRRRVSDLLGEFNVYELPAVVAMIERMTGGSPVEPAVPQPRRVEQAPADADVPSRPVLNAADLAALEREKRLLLAAPWTSKASRRVEELDELTGAFWDAICLEGAA